MSEDPTTSESDPTLPREQPLFDGRYRIVRLLGEGGFGKVFVVEDTYHSDELLALKLVKPEHADKADFAQRFRNEIRVLRQMQHPGIPQIFNDGQTEDGEVYFTMQYVRGTSLEAVLRERGTLDPLTIATFVRQLVGILDYAHSRGVVHRDLKPENIVVVGAGDEERLEVLDFGIAKILQKDGALEQALTMATQMPIGTPHYMAPEQVRGRDVDGRTDLYALGIIIYRMVSGRYPFAGDSAMEILAARLHDEPTPLAAGDGPDWLVRLVRELLAREKEKRPTTARIETLLAQAIDQRRTTNRLLRRGLVLGAVAAVMGVVLGVWRPWSGGLPKAPNEAAVVSTANQEPTAELELATAQAEYDALLEEWNAIELERPRALEGSRLPEGHVEAARAASAASDARGAIAAWGEARDALGAALVHARTEKARLEVQERRAAEAERRSELARQEAERLAANTEAVERELEERLRRTESLGAANFELIKCPKGVYTMGSPSGEEARESDEAQRRVSVGAFWIGETEVTQGQWEAVMGTRPWSGKDYTKNDSSYPVTCVDWNDAVEFCGRLTERERAKGLPAGYAYRLPSEEEWEYACRARTSTAYSFGNDASELARYGVYGISVGDSNAHAVRVKSKDPNPWGLFDMHGNVWEWTSSQHEGGPLRVYRGGSCFNSAQDCRSANRRWYVPGLLRYSLGFRVVLAAKTKPAAEREMEERLSRTESLGGANLTLIRCSAGTYWMGSPSSERGRDDDEERRRVSVGEFWIGETEVTQGQWEAVMGTRPWSGENFTKNGSSYPVTYVDWNDAVRFCERLTERERAEGLPAEYAYRLPSEEEWEYACRAGTSTAYSFGDDASELSRYGVYGLNGSASSAHAARVKSKDPNPWGFFDTHGNVWEWTSSLYAGGPERVSRGGGWLLGALLCRSADRAGLPPGYSFGSLGFRVVLAASSRE